MNSKMKIFLTALIAGAVPAHAGENSGFFLTSPLTLSAGRDTNFLLGNQHLADNVFLLVPSEMSLLSLGRRTELSFRYQPEFELFMRNHEQDAWNHQAGFRLNYRITPRLTLGGGDAFLLTKDPSRQLPENPVLLPRGSYRENRAYINLDYRLNPLTNLDIRFDNTNTNMAFSEFSTASEFREAGKGATVSISRLLDPRQSLSASYSFLKSNVSGLGLPGLNGTFPVSLGNFSLVYNYRVRHDLLLGLSGGVLHGTSGAYTLSGRMEKRLGSYWLKAGYQRYLSSFGQPVASDQVAAGPGFQGGLLPSSLVQVVLFGVRGNFSDRTGIEAGVRASRTSFSLADRDRTNLFSRLDLDYRLTDRLTAFLNLESFLQSQSHSEGIARNRFFGGIRILLSDSPRESSGARLWGSGSYTGVIDAHSARGHMYGEK
ncbi:MAG TPA: hypothetical protein VGL91_00610 [Acidobacteriota bacterium]|jgi:hypothetical protein